MGGLKAQSIVAQGNALGKVSKSLAPCNGKRFIYFLCTSLEPIESLLPLQGDIINGLEPRALPWATMDWAFSPPPLL